MWMPGGLYSYAATSAVPTTTSNRNSTSATIVRIHTRRPRQRATRHATRHTMPAIPLATTATNPTHLCVSNRIVSIAGSSRPRAMASERGVVSRVGRERRVVAAQEVLEHLAGRISGQRLVAQLDVLGHLEVGETLRAVGAEVLGRRGRVGLELHHRLDLLAEHLVRDADDGGVDDVGMLEEGLLDLDAVHVLATPDDHVLRPVDEVEEPVLVEAADVAAAEPAVAGDRLGGRVGSVPVAPAHDRRSAQPDLARRTGRNRRAVGIDDHDLDRRRGT